jgi:hypothetical protein
VALKQHKFTAIPTLMGTTTDELVEVVPQYSGLGSDADIDKFGHQSLPYASSSFLQQLRTYYPESQFQNVGPPLAGSQWSRAVAIVNDLRQFCPIFGQGLEFSALGYAWMCRLIVLDFEMLSLMFTDRWNAVLQSKHIDQWFGGMSSFLGVFQKYKSHEIQFLKHQSWTICSQSSKLSSRISSTSANLVKR